MSQAVPVQPGLGLAEGKGDETGRGGEGDVVGSDGGDPGRLGLATGGQVEPHGRPQGVVQGAGEVSTGAALQALICAMASTMASAVATSTSVATASAVVAAVAPLLAQALAVAAGGQERACG